MSLSDHLVIPEGVRVLPEQEERVETGVTQFGEDWPGIFIRGDNCFAYVSGLKGLLAGSNDGFSRAYVAGLLSLLEGSNVQNWPRKVEPTVEPQDKSN